MDEQAAVLLEKIRQQFDFGPYPRIPIDRSPKDNVGELYIHNFVTPYYVRNQKVIDTKQTTILDAGCGTGYGALILAEANPGAKIVGIDISEKSLELARQRLKHHGFEQIEFHQLSIYELPQLGLEFDYINCDELLYLFPDPAVALQAMKSVLKPEGIIRANLHSFLQRTNYFRAQEVFKMMGLMDENPRELEIELARDTMKALKDQVVLKVLTWNPQRQADDAWVLMNYLFQGDKGYTIPELFAALRISELELISMVNWRQWDLMSLFKEPDNLPVFLAMSLPEISEEQRLHLFELLHPVHRLIDFWCGHPHQAKSFVPVAEWTTDDWQSVKIYLHPQLKTSTVKEELMRCVTQLQPFEISKHLPVTGESRLVDSTIAACLLPLWESPQPMPSLVRRWQQLRPVHPVTLEPIALEEEFELGKQALTGLEACGYVLLDCYS